MITGAIFDIDGTILDSMPIWDHAAEMYLNSIGIEAESNLDKIMFSMSMSEGAKFLQKRYLLDRDVDEIIVGINHTIEDFYYYQVPLKEGVKQFLKDMEQTGIKMVAATSSDRQVVERALKRLDVINFFQKIFTCTEIGIGKVRPDIYLMAAEYMGTSPKDTWVFEDAFYAIETAKNAAFKTVSVFDKSSIVDLEEIIKMGDIYLEKLDDFNIFLKKASL